MTAYEAVSETPLYRTINCRLLDLLPSTQFRNVLDVGCGTGLLAGLVLERCPDATIVAIDPDPEMVAAAQAFLPGDADVRLMGAEEVGTALAGQQFALILLGNCVHLIDDVAGTINMLSAHLEPGGYLAFNTAFFRGAANPADRPIYASLVLSARRMALRSGYREGPKPASRPMATRPSLGPEMYRAVLERSGLLPVAESVDVVRLNGDLLVKIVSSEVFAEGALPRFEPSIAAEFLGKASTSMLAEFPDAEVGRKWYSCVAQRPRTRVSSPREKEPDE